MTKFNDIPTLVKGLLNPQLLESERDHAVARMIGLLGSEETKTNRSAAPNVAVSEFRVSVISFGRLSYLPLNSQARQDLAIFECGHTLPRTGFPHLARLVDNMLAIRRPAHTRH